MLELLELLLGDAELSELLLLLPLVLLPLVLLLSLLELLPLWLPELVPPGDSAPPELLGVLFSGAGATLLVVELLLLILLLLFRSLLDGLVLVSDPVPFIVGLV